MCAVVCGHRRPPIHFARDDMDPEDPESALRIVAEYAHVLEHDEAQPLPAPVRQGAYPERTVKSAILTRATKRPRWTNSMIG